MRDRQPELRRMKAAVGAWYRSFGQVNDEAVAWLIADLRHEASALVRLSS